MSTLFFIPNLIFIDKSLYQNKKLGSFVNEVGGVPTVYAQFLHLAYMNYKSLLDVQLTIFERGNIIFLSFYLLLVISVVGLYKKKKILYIQS